MSKKILRKKLPNRSCKISFSIKNTVRERERERERVREGDEREWRQENLREGERNLTRLTQKVQTKKPEQKLRSKGKQTQLLL